MDPDVWPLDNLFPTKLVCVFDSFICVDIKGEISKFISENVTNIFERHMAIAPLCGCITTIHVG